MRGGHAQQQSECEQSGLENLSRSHDKISRTSSRAEVDSIVANRVSRHLVALDRCIRWAATRIVAGVRRVESDATVTAVKSWVDIVRD